jgi:hypothetical protein
MSSKEEIKLQNSADKTNSSNNGKEELKSEM